MNFDFLSGSTGKVVQLERGGPDKIVGELIGIRGDHLVLRTKEHGVIYCVSDHIKSVTEPIVSKLEPVQSDLEADAWHLSIPVVEAATLQDLLGNMQGNLVQINHSGPNMIKGVLYRVMPGTITLVYDMKEYVHYPIFHIRSISRIYEIIQNQENGKNKERRDSEKQGEESSEKRKGGGK
jgi:spore coat protein B